MDGVEASPESKVKEVPPVPIKTYKWEEVKRARRRGGYPWTYLYKDPFEDLEPDDDEFDDMESMKKEPSSEMLVVEMKESSEENLDLSSNVEILNFELRKPSSDEEPSAEMLESVEMIKKSDSAERLNEAVSQIAAELTPPTSVAKSYFDNEPLVDPNKNEPGTSSGTIKRAKSEEPGRKRKHSIESSYSRISKYSLSKAGFMKRLREAKDKIKFPKFNFSKSESTLNKKAKTNEPEFPVAVEVKKKKAEGALYIHIPLKPPPGETDEFSYLEFEEAKDVVKRPSPIKEEAKEEGPESPIEEAKGVHLIILTAPSDDEILDATPIPETPSETEGKNLDDKKFDELKTIARDVVDKYSPETKRKELKEAGDAIVEAEDEPKQSEPQEETEVIVVVDFLTGRKKLKTVKKNKLKVQAEEKPMNEDVPWKDDQALKSKAEAQKVEDEALKVKDEALKAESEAPKAESEAPKAEAEAPKAEAEPKTIEKIDDKDVLIVVDKVTGKKKLKTAKTKPKIDEVKVKDEVPSKPKDVMLEPKDEEQSKTDDAVESQNNEQPKLKEEEAKGIDRDVQSKSKDSEIIDDDELITKKTKLKNTKEAKSDDATVSTEDTKSKVEGESSDKPPKVKKKKLVKKEKSKEEKIIEAQKTDDDKLEEQKVKMVVDEEDGLKTETVIAQIITDEVHDQEKKSSIKSDSPLLKKKVSFKRRSKDESDGVYEEVQVTTEILKPLEQTQSMSVDEEKTYLDEEKLIKATSLEEDYSKWSKANDHEYEPVNPPPERPPSAAEEARDKKPGTPVTDSDIEFLAAKAADHEMRTTGITTTQPGGDAVFMPLASVLKEPEPEVKELPDSHGKKIHDAIKNQANKLQRQASILTDKASKEAGKFHTRVKSIKRPKLTMPAAPSFQKPQMPKFQKPHMPTMPKMTAPKMPKMTAPKMPKMTTPKMPKMTAPKMPKIPDRMKNMSMPKFTLPKRGTSSRQRRQFSSTTESTSGDSRKKIFDFATYPKMFSRKKKDPDAAINTPRTGTDITPTSEPSTFRPSFLFGNRWKKGKFTETPASLDVAQDSLVSKASERSDAQGSIRVPLHSETSMDNESLDLRSKVEKEADMIVESDDAYMKENQEIHRASSLNAKLNDRWSHGVFRENIANYENDQLTTGPSSLRQQIEQNIHSASYDDIPRPGVVEEINDDEFIVRQKGISRDDIQVREILTSEIKKSFGKSPDDEPYYQQDPGNSDPSLPEVPKRRGLKKPKRKKTPHVSQEALPYEEEFQPQEHEHEILPQEMEQMEQYEREAAAEYQEPERPIRRSRKDHSIDSEGGHSYEETSGTAPIRRPRKDRSLDSRDFDESQFATVPIRKSRKDHSLDSRDLESSITTPIHKSRKDRSLDSTDFQQSEETSITAPIRKSRKDRSLDSRDFEQSEETSSITAPVRKSRKDRSLDSRDFETYDGAKRMKDHSFDSRDYEPGTSGEISQENISRPQRRSRKQYSLDSQDYEGGPSYEISGNATPLSYEISDENILSGNDYLDYKMYENELMEGRSQPGIVVSDPYQESLFHPNFDEVPLAPPRRHRSLKSLNMSEQDSITAELNGYKEISDQNLDFTLPHEYQIPTPEEPPRRPTRTRSRTRSHSRYDDDDVSKRTESFSEEFESSGQMSLEYVGYSVIDKSKRDPKAPRRKRSIKSEQSEERRFHTVPRQLNDVEPVRPLRNYSTLGPSRPPRKHSVPNLTDEEKENVTGSAYIEIEDEQGKKLQSGEVIQKMKDRPLPAPPRPPRKTRDSSRTSSRGPLRDISQERNIFDEAEVSVQTEPLPEGFECEELVQELEDRVITPSKHKRDQRPVTEFEHQETITHGTLIVQPYSRGEIIEDTPVQTFEKSTERIVTVRREVDETTEVPEDFRKLKDSSGTEVPEDFNRLRDPEPRVIERIIERHIPMQMDTTVEMELMKTHKLQVTDLDVDRLSVNELHANTIKVNEIDSSSITTGEINSNSGNLVVSGIELPASFFQQLVEKLQEKAEQVLPRPHYQQETQSSQTDKVEEQVKIPEARSKFRVTAVEEESEDQQRFDDRKQFEDHQKFDDRRKFQEQEKIDAQRKFEEQEKIDAQRKFEEQEKIVAQRKFEEQQKIDAQRKFEERQKNEGQKKIEDELKMDEEQKQIVAHQELEEQQQIDAQLKFEEQQFDSQPPTKSTLTKYETQEKLTDLSLIPLETKGESSQSKRYDIEEESMDPELKKEEEIVRQYEDIASQLRMEEEKFQETLKKVEEIMQKTEFEGSYKDAEEETTTQQSISEGDPALQQATISQRTVAQEGAISEVLAPVQTEVISEVVSDAPPRIQEGATSEATEAELGKKKTPFEERLEYLESVETEIELVVEPPQRPPRSKGAATEEPPAAASEETLSPISKPEPDLIAHRVEAEVTQISEVETDIHLDSVPQMETEPVNKRDETPPPPPRPPQPVIDPEYIPSQPPASFYALRSPPTFKDFDIDDDIPMAPRRRRHHKPPVPSVSSSDEIFPSSSRRRHRTPEPTIPQLTGQLTRACVNAADRSLKRLIQLVTNKVLGTADGKQDVNVVVVILLVLIACLILLGWANDKQVHHHHWEYFNPPRDL